jgi:hypothetical protein
MGNGPDLAHSNIRIIDLNPTRGTDYIHVFIVEGVGVSEVNSTAADQKAYQVHWGGCRIDKTIIWLATCSSVLCILTTIRTLLYKIMIQSATCFNPLAVIIRLISKHVWKFMFLAPYIVR